MHTFQTQRKIRVPSAVLLFLVGATVLAAAGPPAASAGRYKVVDACQQSRAGLTIEDEPIFFDAPITSRGFHVVDKCSPSGDGSITLVAEGIQLLGGKRWVLRAPPDTTIRGVEFDRVAEGPWNVTQLEWSLRRDDQAIESAETVRPPNKRVVHNEPSLETTRLTGTLSCPRREGCIGGLILTASLEVSHLTLTLEDEFFPEFTAPLTGSLVSDEVLRGVEQVSYWAEDRGSGVAGAFLLVDGVAQPLARDLNGGTCQEPYRVPVPCRMQARASVALDTRSLSDGVHEVEVVLVDAAGNEEESRPFFVFVHNAPTNIDPPVITGLAQVGSQLSVSSGIWQGDPSSFSYQWLRCPENAQRVLDCAPIIGATGTRLTLDKRDLKYREVVLVTAVNSAGSEAVASEATSVVSPDERKPALSNVRLSRSQLHLGGPPPTLRFSSSEAGRLTAFVANAKGRALAVIKQKIKAGDGRLTLTKLLRGKAMRPGRYQLQVSVSDATGNVSRPVSLPFKILAG